MSQRVSNFNISSRLRSSSSGTSNTPDQPPCEYIDGVPLDWSGRGTSHVDYDKSEVLPLTQDEFLGHGVHGGVYETSCNGIKLAWKRKYCRRKIGERELHEIEIIKKLSHRHIIRLVGTYTHGPFLGLLLWPVATCDLATLLEDVDWLMKQKPSRSQDQDEPLEEQTDHDADRKARLRALALPTRGHATPISPATAFLKRTIICIASAVAYLHASNIKHKDLKPANILLSMDGLWLTDFSTATDFSVITGSVSENGERGTPKYFALEVASFAPSGRSADIFSLGCILFELITLYMGHTLDLSQKLRQSHDKSFQSNLDKIVEWFEDDLSVGSTAADDYLLGLVRWMMKKEAVMRPTAGMIENDILMINGLGTALCATYPRLQHLDSHRQRCCYPRASPETGASIPPTLSLKSTIEIVHGTRYLQSSPRPICTVYLEHTGESLVESVHIFVDRTHRKSHVVIHTPPYEVNSAYERDISAYVVLRPGVVWDHLTAHLVPKTNERRMMPVLWPSNYRDFKSNNFFGVRNSS